MEAASWRKSRHSGSMGDCVEVGCGTVVGDCVEVGCGTVVGVRDSQDPDGGQLELTPAAWAAFTARLRAG